MPEELLVFGLSALTFAAYAFYRTARP